MPPPAPDRPVRTADVQCERLDDEVLLLLHGTSDVIRLNASATLVWDALMTCSTMHEVLTAVSHMPVADVEDVLTALNGHGLL